MSPSSKNKEIDSGQIGYGIIGCGWVFSSHALAVQCMRNRGVALVAVADSDEQRAKRAAGQYGPAAAYSSAEELLARNDIDVVSLCLPHHMHAPIAIQALRAGKHVICEKPLAPTVADADAMIEAARASGVQLSVVFQHRFDEHFRRLKHAVQADAFGRLLVGQAFLRITMRPVPEFEAHWRDHWSNTGGGVLMNKGIHFLDILLWTLGRVEAAAGTIGSIAASTEVEDTGSATLRFRSGAVGSFTATDAVAAAPMWRVEIHGSHGGAVLEDGHFSFWRTREGYQEPEISGEDLLLSDQQRAQLLFGTGHVKQLMDFVEGIKVGRPPTVPAEDGRHATAVLEAIYRSSATGRFEEVEIAR